MKKIFITAMAAVFMMGMISCKSVNVKREACDKGCETAKKECYNKSKDKKGNVDAKKKIVCDAAAKKCVDECAKKYGY
jgi:hypothetical protein